MASIDTTKSEIHKMLALNNIILSTATWDAIRDGAEWPGLVIYPKDSFGLFIAIDKSSLDMTELPYDMASAVDLAYDAGADWLMFDSDVACANDNQLQLDLSYDD